MENFPSNITLDVEIIMTGQSFKDLERQGWRERAHLYMNLTGPVTTQGMPALLDFVRTHAGIRLLDVC
jgi:hypothetical protein